MPVLKPLLYRQNITRLSRRKAVTVCIAAICDNGHHVVATTDGSLTLGGVSGEVLVPGKMFWYSDWLFLWAGEPGNIDSIIEDIRQVARSKKNIFLRENIRNTVNGAFKKFVADWTADAILAPFDMDMREFKKTGLKVFGEGLLKE